VVKVKPKGLPVYHVNRVISRDIIERLQIQFNLLKLGRISLAIKIENK